jgi:hypothetical protein
MSKSNQSAWKAMYNRLALYLSFLVVSVAFLSDWSPHSCCLYTLLCCGARAPSSRWRMNPEDRGNVFL